jgi:hypothetical protein
MGWEFWMKNEEWSSFFSPWFMQFFFPLPPCLPSLLKRNFFGVRPGGLIRDLIKIKVDRNPVPTSISWNHRFFYIPGSLNRYRLERVRTFFVLEEKKWGLRLGLRGVGGGGGGVVFEPRERRKGRRREGALLVGKDDDRDIVWELLKLTKEEDLRMMK